MIIGVMNLLPAPKWSRALAAWCGVVELGEGESVVGMENGGTGVLGAPDDGILLSVGGDAGCSSGIFEGIAGLRYGRGFQFRVLELKRVDGRTDWSVIEMQVEIGGHGPDAAGKHSGKFLINVVCAGVVFSHVVAVDQVEIAVFAGASGELPGVAGGIFQVGQKNGTAGTEVGIIFTFGGTVVHLEIVGDG